MRPEDRGTRLLDLLAGSDDRGRLGNLRATRVETRVRVALPFACVEPCLNGVDHHCGERDFLIEGVLANALMKIDGKVNRSLAEALAVLGADARLFLRSTTPGAAGRKRGHCWR